MTVKAYYVRGEEWTEVEPDGNRLLLANAGEYHVVYRAESATYTTLLGNPTYAEKDVKILSGVSGDSLAKLHDPNGALPEGTVLMASRIDRTAPSTGPPPRKWQRLRTGFRSSAWN